jgi:hypothetical protein
MHSFEDALPVYRSEDNEHMGYVADIEGTWYTLTTFGIPYGTAANEVAARQAVLESGEAILYDVWEYYDAAAKAWQRCAIIEATPTSVTVSRYDGDHPDPAHSHTINNPTERTLRHG